MVGRRARQPFFLPGRRKPEKQQGPPETQMSALSTSTRASSTCWSCQAATGGEHFCPARGKIQPLPRGRDYFAFFGLPRKLRLDAAELEKRFHRLSWKPRSDSFVRTREYERELLLDRSSQLNDAYRTRATRSAAWSICSRSRRCGRKLARRTDTGRQENERGRLDRVARWCNG